MSELERASVSEARKLYATALRSGELVPADDCESCGEPSEGRALDGHHFDYGKPLEVEWLCRICHAGKHYWELECGLVTQEQWRIKFPDVDLDDVWLADD